MVTKVKKQQLHDGRISIVGDERTMEQLPDDRKASMVMVRSLEGTVFKPMLPQKSPNTLIVMSWPDDVEEWPLERLQGDKKGNPPEDIQFKLDVYVRSSALSEETRQRVMDELKRSESRIIV